MFTLSCSVPETLKSFVENQATKGGYGSPGEYLQSLILEAQLREAKAELKDKLLLGLKSPGSPMTSADWIDLQQQILAKNPELATTCPAKS